MSEKIMKIGKNVLSVVVILFAAFTILNAFFQFYVFNNDNYFMFAHAKVLLEQGFVTTEPLSMHEGFEFIIPQWLFALILYLTKMYLGNTACMWMILIVFALFLFILYKTYLLLSENKEMSFLLTVVIGSAIGGLFLKMRPFVVSGMLGVWEIYLIEKFIRTKNKKYIFLILLNSVLCINMHNSLWIFLFLIHLAYIGEWIVRTILKKNTELDLYELGIISCISLLGGLINPYGIKGITYIVESMISIKPFMGWVTELEGFNPLSSSYFVWIFIASIILLIRYRKEIKLRYLFLYLGTTLMIFMAKRNELQFMTAGLIFLPFALRETRVPVNLSLVKKGLFVILSLSFVFLAIIIRIEDHREGEQVPYEAVDWLYENEDNKDVKIYNPLDLGGYLAYKGFRPYIDARLEVYGIANNKKEDIAKEYIELLEGNCAGFSAMQEKYDFDYVIIPKKYLDKAIKTYMDENKETFDEVYEDDSAWIYKKKEETMKEYDPDEMWRDVDFNKVTIYEDGDTKKMSDYITEDLTVFYIGRDTCSTCKEDGPKLIQMIRDKGVECIELSILGDDLEPSGEREIRRSTVISMGILNVPAFLIFKNNEIQELKNGGLEIKDELSVYIDELM